MAAPVIIVMGPPGAGKGTQCQILAERLNGVHLSSGELLRASANPKIQETMARGELAESADVIEVFDQALIKVSPHQPIVIDGFTRMKQEAEWLQQRLPALGRSISMVINLVIDQQESIQRNYQRGRQDDALSAQYKRWEEYMEETQPVLSYYNQQGLLKEIDGNGSVEEVSERIKQALED